MELPASRALEDEVGRDHELEVAVVREHGDEECARASIDPAKLPSNVAYVARGVVRGRTACDERLPVGEELGGTRKAEARHGRTGAEGRLVPPVLAVRRPAGGHEGRGLVAHRGGQRARGVTDT
eukprot:scaffold29926_cov69-Phaeocystis_antarctica.AAC.3